MDAFLDDGNCSFPETEINSTPNIEFQMDRYMENEPISLKQIPEKCLFGMPIIKQYIKNIYDNGIDLPFILSGYPGCGKLSIILGLLSQCSIYCPDLQTNNEHNNSNNSNNSNNNNENNKNSENSENSENNNSNIINTVRYFKILDREYPKLLSFENAYFLNVSIISSNNEINSYFRYINKLNKSRSIDNSKKIFIISHIDKTTYENQRYIAMILDKLTARATFIFTTNQYNNIDIKIRGSCCHLRFKPLTKSIFTQIFLNNYETIFNKKELLLQYLNKYYEIYKNNNYNIGNTIAQIKYLLCNKEINLTRGNEGNDLSESLMDKIVRNFIKKRIKLSTVNNSLEIRKILYTLLSLNINLLDFSKTIIKQLITGKLNDKIKLKILEQGKILSIDLQHVNKDVIAVETFIYALINIIYSAGSIKL